MTKDQPAAEKAKGPINKDLYKQAVTQGKASIKEGKPKVEVAMAIYALLKNESRETVVNAFIEGATLTEAGALTYWYNCRRKSKKS